MARVGIQAFSEDGQKLWSMPCGEGGMAMFAGQSSIESKGTLVIGEVELTDPSTYDFYVRGFSTTTGNQLWVNSPSIKHVMGFGSTIDSISGQIYLTLGNDLTAVSSEGYERWLYNASKALSANIAIGPDSRIYIGEVGSGSSGEDNDYELIAVNSLGGKMWSFQCMEPILAGPIVDANGEVYIATRDGSIYCVNPDGTQNWQMSVGGNVSYLTFGPSGSLLLGVIQPQFTTSVVCIRDPE